MFVEMSEELAKDEGITNGEEVMVKTSRGKVEATAIVTPRIKPFNIDGNIIHKVGIPWHFGWVTRTAAKQVRSRGQEAASLYYRGCRQPADTDDW